MKKNIGKLIVEVKNNLPSSRGSFKVQCKDAHKYTNKILINSEDLNQTLP